ncbi:HAMP domain-containing sensor histidine kinase [Hyphomicrobium sp.]|uniref:sensor histidine kinase n=1 Tax=Hyphomicrobium sp. TaxID=82 RepID=UPI002E36E48F|nr:HAMP domain-containing sensor histidine kinase [Hyphomicrobium sp.]HEX2843289.1 HAMP domain-containing sensor histidine kinase [Hyphomicrobium sp.]
MAGTLSACPRDGSVLGNEAQTRKAVSAILSTIGPIRLLQVAAAVYACALAYTVAFHAFSLPSVAIVVSGLVLTLLALRLSQLNARPSSDSSSTTADLSPAKTLSLEQQGSGASPSPLPFIGERIAINRDAVQLTGLARAAARLSHLSSVRAHPWGDLIARVSHELRTPLNAVIGFSDVMQSELLGPVGHPRYREYARHIRDCGRDLLKSAEDTLAITCLLDHDPNSVGETGVDFRQIVEQAWSFHSDRSESRLSLVADIPEGLEVLVDSRPLRQILINLFAEAVRRSDAGGILGLVATLDGDLAQIEIFLRGQPGEASVGQASLPICLARALLELHGATLVEVDDPYSTWRAVTVLRCAAQNDFFGRAETFVPSQPALC